VSSASAKTKGDERIRFPGVPAPKPLLSVETERQLSPRQREILVELEGLLGSRRLSELTMSEIAAEVNCSLRTLYGIAPSKDELVLAIVDRRLRRIGRKAIESLDASLSPLETLRAYLRAANKAVQPTAVTLSEDLAGVAGAKRLLDAHADYVMAATRSLLDRAVAEGEIEPLDTASLAHVLGRLGGEFARPEVAELAQESPKATADRIADVILRGLAKR